VILVRTTNFYDLKEQLVRENRIFDRETMKLLEYPDLILCAIGDAGKARCDIKVVAEEAAARRSAYANYSLQRILELRRVLEHEGMYEDVLNDAISRSEILSWKKLTDLQKLYFKLLCLRNHQDYPGKRLDEALTYLALAAKKDPRPELAKWQTTLETLSNDIRTEASAWHLRAEQDSCLSHVHFRKSIQGVRGLLELMSPSEVMECEAETLRDYSCSHNCFAPNI
jgi:hypothetical protein